jgi:hypothetical protein
MRFWGVILDRCVRVAFLPSSKNMLEKVGEEDSGKAGTVHNMQDTRKAGKRRVSFATQHVPRQPESLFSYAVPALPRKERNSLFLP